jgi:cysteinyl-tRNA synthetase
MAAIQKEAAGKGDVKASLSLAAINKMDSVLSLDVIKGGFEELEKQENAAANAHAGDPEAAEIDALVAERTQAKKDKNFARADEIRDILTKKGIVVTDTAYGPVWSRG